MASCPIGGDIVLLGNYPGGIIWWGIVQVGLPCGELSRWDYPSEPSESYSQQGSTLHIAILWGIVLWRNVRPDTMKNSLTNAKVATLTNSKGLCELI